MGVIKLNKYAIILNNIVTNITTSNIAPVFSKPIRVIDISDYGEAVKPWFTYDEETNTFSEGSRPEPEFESESELEPKPEPEPESVETMEGRLIRMEQKLQDQQQQNLILVDINLTVYEELLNMKEQFAQLNGATDNA